MKVEIKDYYKNLRLYTFVNKLYMSPIQHGIQTAHVVSTMHGKYGINSEVLNRWAKKDHTIIVLDGTCHGRLQEIGDVVCKFARRYKLPYAIFKEDEYSLNNATTCVGIVLPEDVYSNNFGLLNPTNNTFSGIDFDVLDTQMFNLMSKARLA